ncbi:MAG: ribonuclease H-like domain-containing protein [Candidatus Zixiibacteriota bacterium]|nr:MAG: ribonuclease H-like domain-containing protein [candidate division Zixibacteria bacterium]
MDLEKRLYEALKLHKTTPQSPKPDLCKKPPIGKIRETDLGPVWMVETVYDEGYLHGRTELSKSVRKTAQVFLGVENSQETVNLNGAAVIDTETTGLAGGTGTYPFIIGIGFWRKNKFVVRQYILRDFSEEPAQLSSFAEDLNKTSSLLTYNGKSFDMPLLRTRFRINRMKVPFIEFPHIDLLHPCRRIYRNHFDSFNLTFLEAMILGFERVDDVPSHLIPGIYFDFLQNRDDDLLIPILYHNRDDIVSLYMLAQETARRIDLALCGASNDDYMFLSLAKILFTSRDYNTAEKMLGFIKSDFAADTTNDDAMMMKSVTAKRVRDWDKAQSVWKQMIKCGRFGVFPHIELAKHLEHRAKDFHTALDLTNSAMKLLEFERDFFSTADYRKSLGELKYRQKRLKRKIDKKNAG